ncbi:MAG: peroxidase family protein, partial [Gemmatimonadaceae bacterium]
LPANSPRAHCDYKPAPFFNVLAAFWIQFMTHDWFSHLEEGHNTPTYMSVGCANERVNGADTPLTPSRVAELRCRPSDQMERAYVADSTDAFTKDGAGATVRARAPKTFRNTTTAWWDASQLYGYDNVSRQRVKRDPHDPARLLLVAAGDASAATAGQRYLPLLASTDPQNPDWKGQEAAAFADNWNVGLSFLHNVFAREHNLFVDAFRQRAQAHPDEDSGLRDPAAPTRAIPYKDVTPDVLFDVSRLVIAAEIAKIHTIEWTTQLLYDESLYRGMNSNWSGLLKRGDPIRTLLTNVVNKLRKSDDPNAANTWYSILASGPGIVGSGNMMGSAKQASWSIANDANVNGGINHFGSPFNFPEEFVTVYRLHTLVPDLLEFRDLNSPDSIRYEIPVVETFRGGATRAMHERGLANWAISLGRQRLAQLSLQNTPQFLQNLRMDRLRTPTKQIDVAALDIIRDRERGVPRFNEFRRQYGLRQLTSFDDFIDVHPNVSAADHAEQQKLVALLREVYGQHACDASKIITRSQLDANKQQINDCLGHADKTMVDNVEDLDTVVGWLAESTRPHGYAISETQFVVFILNASRRLYSDRFFTSSFRPEIYSTLGYEWVNQNGPMAMTESLASNGHTGDPVSPMKRVLLRTMPELKGELDHVVNAFDPWARDRGAYYSLQWRPRKGAERDESFAHPH